MDLHEWILLLVTTVIANRSVAAILFGVLVIFYTRIGYFAIRHISHARLSFSMCPARRSFNVFPSKAFYRDFGVERWMPVKSLRLIVLYFNDI